MAGPSDTKYETHEHDVIVIGAGGAGLRAAIEASAEGASVGLVCKSLLGKAHTVMAEGGVAAALGQRRAEGQLEGPLPRHDEGRPLPQPVAHGAAPRDGGARPRERARGVGRALRSHAGRADPPAQLRRPQVPAPRARRRPHGPRDDPHAPAARHPLRDAGVHGVHGHAPARATATGSAARSATGARTGSSSSSSAKAIVLATGGIGRTFKINSNSWECTGDGQALAYLAGAELMDMEFMQFHPTGMVWPPSVRGTLITEGVRGEGGTLRNKDGKRIMFDYIPELYANETASTEEEADQWLRESTLGQAVEGQAHAGPLAARHRRARDPQRGEAPGAGRRTAASSSTSTRGAAPRTSSASCRRCTTSSRSWATSTSPRSRWRSGRRRTTRWAASGSTRRRRSRASRASSPPASARPVCTGPTGWAATR